MKLLHHGAQDRLIGSGEQERGTIENGDLKDQFIRLPWTIASVKCNLERILFIKPRYKIVWLCQIPFPTSCHSTAGKGSKACAGTSTSPFQCLRSKQWSRFPRRLLFIVSNQSQANTAERCLCPGTPCSSFAFLEYGATWIVGYKDIN